MKLRIISEDKRLIESMEEFVRGYESGFGKELNKLKYKIVGVTKLVKGFVKIELIKEDTGCLLVFPFDLPDMIQLRQMLRKYGFNIGESGWKTKVKEAIKGFLREKNVDFEDVKWVD